MKKLSSYLLILIFVLAQVALVGAEERILQLTVPGCFSWGAERRIGTILRKIDGVKKHQVRQPNILIIAFDDDKTSLDIIGKALHEGAFIVRDKPVYLKSFPESN